MEVDYEEHNSHYAYICTNMLFVFAYYSVMTGLLFTFAPSSGTIFLLLYDLGQSSDCDVSLKFISNFQKFKPFLTALPPIS